ncbi:MAG TPA: hypothetical protein VK524_18470 [Polyangiaceae bacterium]|nr:hypothetical protein [Polyangiaceae bacterium]
MSGCAFCTHSPQRFRGNVELETRDGVTLRAALFFYGNSLLIHA